MVPGKAALICGALTYCACVHIWGRGCVDQVDKDGHLVEATKRAKLKHEEVRWWGGGLAVAGLIPLIGVRPSARVTGRKHQKTVQ